MPSRPSRSRHGIGGVGVLVVLLAALGCAPITVTQEQQLGYRFQQEMRQSLPLVQDVVVNDYVSDMGQAIVDASGPQPFQYRFHVIYDDEINAFAGPAGYIYIHTETILRARNAAELAGVIAHEVGHVARRHIAENYNRQRNTEIGRSILVAGASIAAGGMVGGAADLGTALATAAYLNKFGRDAEMEADAFAVEVLPKVGYDPEGLPTFFETLGGEGGAHPAPFLSSHPATDDRIEATRAAIAALPHDPTLRLHDGGRLGLIQRRLLLLTRRTAR